MMLTGLVVVAWMLFVQHSVTAHREANKETVRAILVRMK